MQLSKRLFAVSEMVTSNSCIADIGTDHGYIPIYLMETGRITGAIAMDINKGPLARAKENIMAHGLEKYIETRLSDGLKELRQEEAKSVVIAGMGGALIIKILTEGKAVLDRMEELILQPQSEIDLVRTFLEEQGYCIVQENMVLDEGKFYPMMGVVHKKMQLVNRASRKYGPLLLKERNTCLLEFLDRELHMYETIKEKLSKQDGESAKKRMIEVQEELNCIEEAKEYYK